MKRVAEYETRKGKVEVEYDDEAPCIVCGEPVVAASMGGTVLCPWCDTGHCRYCGVTIMVLREEIDGGSSKRNLLEHMRQHREKEPERNQELLKIHREIEKKLKVTT